MKRILTVLSLLALVTAFLVVVAAAGASHRVAVNSPVKGSFKYCDNPTFPPMESTTTSGKPVGFDIDMAAAIAKLWGVKPFRRGRSTRSTSSPSTTSSSRPGRRR